MLRVPRVVPLLLVALGALVLFFCAEARAQDSRPQGLHILEIDSDTADEQAEALTGALRSRVRGANGWVLLETTQSLSMLTAALRCPPRPDAGCLQRIGDQLKTDQFLWGVLSKGGGGVVTADVHRWTRGKPDLSTTETYSENLKDQNDDNLKRIASRMFDRLTGGPVGTIVVHAGSTVAPGVPLTGAGSVLVDGSKTFAFDHGVATMFLSGGTHVVEVRATGFTTSRRNVVATVGTKQDLNIDLAPAGAAVVAVSSPGSGSEGGSGGGSTRKALTIGALVGGGVLVATGVVLGVVFEVERGDLQTDLANNYGTHVKTPIITDPCAPPKPFMAGAGNTISQGCSAHNTASSVGVPEAITLGVGVALLGTGLILLATSPKDDAPAASHGFLRDVRVLPEAGPHGGALGLSASF